MTRYLIDDSSPTGLTIQLLDDGLVVPARPLSAYISQSEVRDIESALAVVRSGVAIDIETELQNILDMKQAALAREEALIQARIDRARGLGNGPQPLSAITPPLAPAEDSGAKRNEK